MLKIQWLIAWLLRAIGYLKLSAKKETFPGKESPLVGITLLRTENENGKWRGWPGHPGSTFGRVLVFSAHQKAMAPHSSTLAWKIPWTEEPGRLQSMGSLKVRHDWATSLSIFTFMHWRRKWQPTPVFLPGESQGRGSLVGCRLWGHTESDPTEAI